MGPITTYDQLIGFLANPPLPLAEVILDEPVLWYRTPKGRIAHLNERCARRNADAVPFKAPLRRPGLAVCSRCFAMPHADVTSYIYRVQVFQSSLDASLEQLAKARTGSLIERLTTLSVASADLRYAALLTAELDDATADRGARTVAATNARIEAFRAKYRTAEDALVRHVVLAAPGAYGDASLIGDDNMSLGKRYAIDRILRVAHRRSPSLAAARLSIRTELELHLRASEARRTAAQWLRSAEDHLAAVAGERTPTSVYLRRFPAGWKSSELPTVVWWFYSGRSEPEAFATMPEAVAKALHRFAASHAEACPSVVVTGPAAESDTPATYVAAAKLVIDGLAPSDALTAARLLD